MAAGSEGVSAVVGTGQHRLGGIKETDGRDNNDIIVKSEEEADVESDKDSGGEEESQGASGLS